MAPVLSRPLPTLVPAVLAGLAAALVLSGCSATSEGGDGPTSDAAPTSIPAEDGPGVTDEEVALSWSTLFTSSNVTPELLADIRAGADAVLAEFNAEGGLGGRAVTIVAEDPGNELVNQRQDAYQQAQFLALPDPTEGRAACDAYGGSSTAVFALIGSNLTSAPLGTSAAAACLNADGHPVIGVTGWRQADFEAAPASAGLSLSEERSAAALVAAGTDAGIIGAGGKVALVTDSTDASDRVAQVYQPALAEAGVEDPEIYPLAPSATPAEALNTALKLKDAGVESVIYLSGPVVASTLAAAIQEQGYYPRQLALDASPFMPDVAYDDQTLSSIASYVSVPDPYSLTPEQQAASAQTPAGELCAAAAEAAPEAAEFVSIDLCDALVLLREALEASGSEYVNAEAFAVGLGELGTDYESPRLFATEFTPQDHGGAAGVARESFSVECQCVEVSSDVVTF